MAVRVCVVEPQVLFHQAWRALLEADDLEVAAIAATPESLPGDGCDVVVLDVDAQPAGCHALIGRTRVRFGAVGVCVIAVHLGEELQGCVERGEATVALKTEPSDAIRNAVRLAAGARVQPGTLRV
jgi:DNA-binding NarL/FixJ family response regulator